ncbi:MAG: class I adenylate-forming enzyme family protein [Rhodoglobus sp.]|nr:class I adenylate-forming enzyme family protein [Rhodoglobus sp.]
MSTAWAIDPDAPSLAALFERAVEAFPDGEGVVHDETRLTYAQWWQHAGGLAEELRRRGVRPGDVVIIGLPSSAEYAVAYVAIARLGAVASGVNPRLGSGEIAHVLAKTDPAAIICGTDLLDRIPPDYRDRVLPVEDFPRFVGTEPGPVAAVEADAPAVIVWTSGTTGLPKGAWFDTNGLRASALGSRDFVRPFDRRLVPLPFVHAGFMTKVWEIVASGTTLVITPVPWRAAVMLDLIERERITVATGVPTQWEKVMSLPDVVDRDLSALRYVITSTAPASPELIRRLEDGLRVEVAVRFASTESGPATGTRPGDAPDVVSTTLGRPLPDAEISIVDDDGVALPAGAIGTVRVRHPGRMRGYWRDPEQTAKTLSLDGWITTGDLGWLTDDGNLVLTGRSTEMYIRGGYNVYPREVELALLDHPSVRDAAVLGMPAPVIGEQGVAVLVPEDPDAPPTLEEVRDFLRGRIADYKLPDVLCVVPELPLTAFMKVSRPELRTIAEQHLQGHSP